MDIFNNTTKVVKDDLTKKIKTGSKVAIAAASVEPLSYIHYLTFSGIIGI